MNKIFILLIFLSLFSELFSQELIIQENELGFCSVDGKIDIGSRTVSGWTGIGFADGDPGIGKSMSWQISVTSYGNYFLTWRYAIGGNPGSRNARLVINGNVIKDTIYFPHTGTWSNWVMSDPIEVFLKSGTHKIRIEAYSTSGLGNYDYFQVNGEGLSPAECTPSYVVSVSSNNPEWGMVSYEPVQDYYDYGTLVTLRANANTGYFFQSWTGEETSEDSVFTFEIKSNVNAVARFLPSGTKMDEDIIGYAAIQDDKGTPYLVTGGSLGQTVEVSSLQELKQYLNSPEPYTVKFTGYIEANENIKISSDKTLIGTGEVAHLKGIGLEINNVRNIIIRNLTISHVAPQDAIEINGKSKNIFISGCEFYSDRDHGPDYYDGLLDIKNESTFITVSWSSFHDHYKAILISSGDQQVADSVIRITLHHNYFYNCGSRLPSIRFGKAHIFNNYYKNSTDGINTRMGACVRIERNYFENVGKAVMMDYSVIPGTVHLIDNYFGSSAFVTSPKCELNIPYNYEHFLDETNDVPIKVINKVKTGLHENTNLPVNYSLNNYPNPFNSETRIVFSLIKETNVSL